jgi:hypothetical protein
MAMAPEILPYDEERDEEEAMECSVGRSGLDDSVETFREDGAINRVVEGDGGSNRGLGE